MQLKPEVERYRIRVGSHRTITGANYGAFVVPKLYAPAKTELHIIASCGDLALGLEWEHVSISTEFRCPYWMEMCFVKNLFWDEEETVMQLHPPKSRWINNHDFCLHLWRPLTSAIPLPPLYEVGIKGVTHNEMQGMSAEAREALLEAALVTDFDYHAHDNDYDKQLWRSLRRRPVKVVNV